MITRKLLQGLAVTTVVCFVVAYLTQNVKHGVGAVIGGIGWFGFLITALLLVVLSVITLVRSAVRRARATG